MIAFLIIAMTGLGVLGVVKMKAINADAAAIQSEWLPSVDALGELRANVIARRTIVRQHLLSDTAEAKQVMEMLLEDNLRSNDEIRRRYEKLVTLPAERALYAEWGQVWEAYLQGVRQVLALSRNSRGIASQEARDLNINTVSPIGTRVDEILKKSIELNNRQGDAAGKEAAETYRSAVRSLAIILGITVLIGTAVGVYIVRDVSRSITSIVTPMRELAAGHLDVVVPHRGENNEIGTMADALQFFKLTLIAKKAVDDDAAAEMRERATRLAVLATTDRLTGLYNRLKFDQALVSEIARAKRYEMPFSLVMYDVDRFKDVNDVHGHPAGDRVLVGLSDAISSHLRETDMLARWGGEEFAILLTGSDCHDACVVAEKLRTAVAQIVFDQVGSVTCSFGVTEYRDGDTPEVLVARADAALYQAKLNGRNRVELALPCGPDTDLSSAA
ncbi:diguanylate cyclase (GGDEF)-like protein [Rhodopseudomonas rhenobacensis]|uniref:diguanylate cyclase n=1 Tax=Rhodopseudomonas rhenobacensis TaxID=87461 RepID=A0A7W8DZ60_9BRAD|nr:diguanylate cyclase (GGDEF)-like protein [Rhodopseudomonas rhenobacensis]